MRRRVSTTVDDELLERARGIQAWESDAAMIDAALKALTDRHRQAEIDAAYKVYERIPLNTPDAWGDLESFLTANLHPAPHPTNTEDGPSSP